MGLCALLVVDCHLRWVLCIAIPMDKKAGCLPPTLIRSSLAAPRFFLSYDDDDDDDALHRVRRALFGVNIFVDSSGALSLSLSLLSDVGSSMDWKTIHQNHLRGPTTNLEKIPRSGVVDVHQRRNEWTLLFWLSMSKRKEQWFKICCQYTSSSIDDPLPVQSHQHCQYRHHDPPADLFISFFFGASGVHSLSDLGSFSKWESPDLEVEKMFWWGLTPRAGNNYWCKI